MNTLSGKKIRIITVILTYSLTIARNSTFMCVRIKAAILNKKFRLFLFHLRFLLRLGIFFSPAQQLVERSTGHALQNELLLVNQS